MPSNPVPGPGRNIPAAAPQRRTMDIRSLSYALSGNEGPYPVYQFSGFRYKYEFRGHNPFFGLENYLLDETSSSSTTGVIFDERGIAIDGDS